MKNSAFYLLFLFLLLQNSCSNFEEDTGYPSYENSIKIVFLGPISKIRASVESRYLAANLAVEEINSKGGINHKKLELELINDSGNVDFALKKLKELHKNGLDLIIGSAWSEITLGIADYIVQNKMLMISYSATNSQISKLKDSSLIWRTCPPDNLQAKALADYIIKQNQIKTIGIIGERNEWSIGISDDFINRFTAQGGLITNYVLYPEETNNYNTFDYTAYLDTVFAKKPEAVFLASLQPDGIKISHDIVRNNYLNNGYLPVFLAGDALKNEDVLNNANQFILEHIYGTVAAPPKSDPNYVSFKEAYSARYGFTPSTFNSNAYDAIYCLAYAILAAKNSIKPSDIASELRNISGGNPLIQGKIINVNEFDKAMNLLNSGEAINYNGASGKIDFNAKGDPTHANYDIWTVRNKKFKIITSIDYHGFLRQ